MVIQDSADAVVIHQPTGAPTMRRTGARGGPRNSMLAGGWDGGYQERPWRGEPSVRAHEPGKPFSVIRGWDPQREEFAGWYVNLELPWAATEVGFDSRDLILDILADDDGVFVGWKDEEQLAWSVETAILSQGQADWIRTTGESVRTAMAIGTGVFAPESWRAWTPDPGAVLPALPAAWADGPAAMEIPSVDDVAAPEAETE
ncbi:DUF402 domain-containing protein [Kribbella sp. NPDC051718]|uniref:DUF402 domain-containing protein n=1 Tax=Kribbella sp. NPDC051718 TaxID=3155168 RepID=UPI00341F907A